MPAAFTRGHRERVRRAGGEARNDDRATRSRRRLLRPGTRSRCTRSSPPTAGEAHGRLPVAGHRRDSGRVWRVARRTPRRRPCRRRRRGRRCSAVAPSRRERDRGAECRGAERAGAGQLRALLGPGRCPFALNAHAAPAASLSSGAADHGGVPVARQRHVVAEGGGAAETGDQLRALLAPADPERVNDPGRADEVVVVGAADQRGVPVARQRDAGAEEGVADAAAAGELRALLRPRAARAAEGPDRARRSRRRPGRRSGPCSRLPTAPR